VVPSVDDLRDEAFVIMSAASDTTGNAMIVAMYGVVSNRNVYSKLTAELNSAFPDPSTNLEFLALEKLPYLVRSLQPYLAKVPNMGRLP
jgi:cytochrome P450